MKWIDTRIQNPSPKAANKYIASFLIAKDIPIIGYAQWMPDDGYETGHWEDCYATTGNHLDKCEVLYWMEWPALPEILKR